MGAPIEIPPILQTGGSHIDEVKEHFEDLLEDECGGDLCVTIVVEPVDSSVSTVITTCQYWGTDPLPGEEAERGSTVTLLTGNKPSEEPCDFEESGDSDDPGDSEDSGGSSPPDTGEDAVGAPIEIPDIVTALGASIGLAKDRFENSVTNQCDGDLCVTVVVEPGDPPERLDYLTTCQFWKTDPPPETQVDRGSTVYLLTGNQPCEEEPDPTDTPGVGS